MGVTSNLLLAHQNQKPQQILKSFIMLHFESTTKQFMIIIQLVDE